VVTGGICTRITIEVLLYYIVIGVRRPEFQGVPVIFSGRFLNSGPLLTIHVGMYVNVFFII
jgi:hypothetical protein